MTARSFYAFAPVGGGFRAQYAGAIDGDTIDVIIDLGFNTLRKDRVRLNGIDTPELNSSDPAVRAAAQKARAFVDTTLSSLLKIEHGGLYDRYPMWPLRLVTAKGADKYGRYLADVYYYADDQERHLNAELVDAGLATPYDGGKKT